MVAINLRFLLAAIAVATSTALAAPSAVQGQTFHAPQSIPSVWKSLGAVSSPFWTYDSSLSAALLPIFESSCERTDRLDELLSHPLSPYSFVTQALGTDSLTYTMSLKGQNMEGLTQKMNEIASSNGEWLTKDELKQYASASDEAKAAITNYLKSQGLSESDYTFSSLGDEVQIKSSVAQASKMLAAKFESFLLSGKDKAARTKEYTVDASIAQYVQNIYPIADFQHINPPNLHTKKDNGRAIQALANAPAGCDTAKVTPQCLVSRDRQSRDRSEIVSA